MNTLAKLMAAHMTLGQSQGHVLPAFKIISALNDYADAEGTHHADRNGAYSSTCVQDQ
jgi:hypothetical protein